ncbi:outer membrane beta-barrel protein [Granulicella arctica]|uniref:Opacity protein-like surface antigen n=1 Tax=Granulicella arctica TaxID=940613 RepID=A0A7Y9PJT6_9BACT|nr:outer membrane beta-barrel protein [Granulicella arctica]NYF81214.1 opacity protein-like surface antigen [Granulicella arctica]
MHLRVLHLGTMHMLKGLLLLTLLAGASGAYAQAKPTASRLLDLQAGGLFINANSDYARSRFNGYGAYADGDFYHGFGAEAEFRYITDQDPYVNLHEHTYEIGPRYSRHYGRFQPYAKLLIGRGVFNYPENTANLAYNLGALGAGTDIRIFRHVNARIDYEYQHWFSFKRNGLPSDPNDSLSPDALSAGIAYHF